MSYTRRTKQWNNKQQQQQQAWQQSPFAQYNYGAARPYNRGGAWASQNVSPYAFTPRYGQGAYGGTNAYRYGAASAYNHGDGYDGYNYGTNAYAYDDGAGQGVYGSNLVSPGGEALNEGRAPNDGTYLNYNLGGGGGALGQQYHGYDDGGYNTGTRRRRTRSTGALYNWQQQPFGVAPYHGNW